MKRKRKKKGKRRRLETSGVGPDGTSRAIRTRRFIPAAAGAAAAAVVATAPRLLPAMAGTSGEEGCGVGIETLDYP